MLQGWLDAGGEAEVRAHGLDATALMAETQRRNDDARRRTARLVDAFLDQVAQA